MKDDNFAIVVGISRYRGHTVYPPLDGPVNDVELFSEWLRHPAGGNVKEKNLCRLVTPAELAGAQPDDDRRSDWTPTHQAFSEAFEKIAIESGKYKRRESRLYLYFSGHGFSQDVDMTAKAALFAANAHGPARPNIPGTVYAEAVKRVALFKEIVLIMDCCRDVQRNSPFGAYELDMTESGNAEKVKLIAIYATAKNGKAQEREFTTDGKVFGLLTHGLVRALDAAPTNVLGQVSSTTLTNYLKTYWEEWCPKGHPAPQPPRIVPSDLGDVFFGSRKALVTQTFEVGPATPGTIRLQSAELDALGEIGADQVIWSERNDPTRHPVGLDVAGGAKQFALQLPPIEHTVMDAQSRATRTFLPGTQHVFQL